ncbi:NifU family protein [Sphaerisporangium sp. TRM90804]|uniref:NifU family protein n=1 Tax=Sphaerisporangium sp. TRM90804 TaxID=3031113 RepID=UPI002448BBF4|nr:NifU family protein [Sphaerisporangium sp. TRM90804]MDH2429029.1 NifU family protein [Sphaerisporangium sp. TRM90804]
MPTTRPDARAGACPPPGAAGPADGDARAGGDGRADAGRPARDAADVRAVGDRVEALIDELGALADPMARARAEELVRVMVGLYGAGLERVVGIVVESGASEVLHRLTADEVVSGLLVVHDLHPLTTEERVRAALDGVRPLLARHEGGVELLGVDAEGVVRLRLSGGCDGCASSRDTVSGAVERAIAMAAPEVARVEVEGVAAEPSAPLLQIGRRPPGPCPVPREAGS